MGGGVVGSSPRIAAASPGDAAGHLEGTRTEGELPTGDMLSFEQATPFRRGRTYTTADGLERQPANHVVRQAQAPPGAG